MRRSTVRHALLALLLFAIPALCLAQGSAEPPASARPAVTAAEAQAGQPGFFARAVAAVIGQQRQFHRKLAATLETIRTEGTAAAGWTLILTSFLYGVFHAAGPGHGKAVLTAYLATHRERLLRGILMAAAAAAVQGIVAILLVFGLTMLAGWAARDTQSAVRWAEQLSFALIAALGGYLVWRAAGGLRRLLTRMRAPAHAHAHDDCGHGHCGHDHFPAPGRVASARDLKAMAGVVLSVGIRPCSGAVLVLAVANLFEIPWAGIAAVFAMSLGTALAVATMALLVLSAKQLAATLIATDTPGVAIAGQLVALAGGAVILVLGAALFAGSFGPVHPLGM